MTVLSEHREWRVIWPGGLVDGPFRNRREAAKFIVEYGKSGATVQARTVTRTATEWADA